MVHCQKGRGFLKTLMKSDITSVLFLYVVLPVTWMVEEGLQILSWPIKQVVRDCETGSDSKINLKNRKSGLWEKEKKECNLKDGVRYHTGRNV